MDFEINPDQVIVPLGYPRTEPEPELRTSFDEYGQLTPITLIEEDGKWFLFDGWKRLSLCMESGVSVKAVSAFPGVEIGSDRSGREVQKP